MARRGRCRCGRILKFRHGPEGYKMRCPGCNSVVRLVVEDAVDAAETAFCICGQMVQLEGSHPGVCPHCGSLVLPKKVRAPKLAEEDAFAPTEMVDAMDAEWLRKLKREP